MGKFIVVMSLSGHNEQTLIKVSLEELHFDCNVLSMTVNVTPDDCVKRLFNQWSN